MIAYCFSTLTFFIWACFIRVSFTNTCDPIKSQWCYLNYSKSELPNLIGHLTQDDILLSLYSAAPYMTLKCNRYIRDFICQLHYPKCGLTIPPCKSFCLQIHLDCEFKSLFSATHIPQYFDCNKYTEKAPCFEQFGFNTTRSEQQYRHPKFVCPYWLTTATKLNYHLFFSDEIIQNCGQPCYYPINVSDKSWFQNIKITLILFSIMCFVFSLFTVISFGLGTTRYSFPEKGVILIAVCYCFIAISLIVGYSLNNATICHNEAQQSKQHNISVSLIDQGSTVSRSCTILFIGFYFFLMSSILWWFMMTLTLFLSSAYHWAQESINKNTHFFHLFVWSTAAIITVILVGLGHIEGDTRLGICLPGVTRPLIKIIFLIFPFSLLLILGIIFFGIACHHLKRVYYVLKENNSVTSRFKRLIHRTVWFSIFYILAWIIIIVIWILDVINHEHLVNIWKSDICNEKRFGEYGCPKNTKSDIKLTFHEPLFILQLFCLLVCGALPCIITVNKKTFSAFSHCFRGKKLFDNNETSKSNQTILTPIAVSTDVSLYTDRPIQETTQNQFRENISDINEPVYHPTLDDLISTSTSSYPYSASVVETLYLQNFDEQLTPKYGEASC